MWLWLLVAWLYGWGCVFVCISSRLMPETHQNAPLWFYLIWPVMFPVVFAGTFLGELKEGWNEAKRKEREDDHVHSDDARAAVVRDAGE